MGVEMTGRRCDVCKVAGAHLFCKADMAYLCTDCDGKIHGANKLAIRHERVWMCEVCEQAPASVTCKADAAALCVSCDVDIHSANPLARRHERIPIVPFYDVIVSKPIEQMEDEDDDDRDEELDGEEAVSWLLPNPNPCSNPKTVDYFFSDVDPYLDLDYNSTMEAKLQANSDSIVPSKQTPSYSFGTESLSHSLSSSSTEIGLVPEADVSNPFPGAKPGVDCFPSPTATTTTQLSGLDREARVLRYREKRKNRKFEKTIRYASRKAYAETRPRIKGRFAKRSEIEGEQLFADGSYLPSDGGYGIVPSF